MSEPIALLTEVTRRYGPVTALDSVSLTIEAGEFVGLLGPNGAGKSTLINLLLGLRRPQSGTVTLFGGSPLDPARRAKVGATPQETALPENLRVGEVCSWVAGHFADPAPQDELLARFGLADTVRRQTGGLSGGQRRKLALAIAMIGRPHLLILDEPTTGLDVSARHELWASLRQAHAQGVTILLTSHYLEEIEQLCQRVVVLDDGQVRADDALDAVLSRVGVHVIELTSPRPDLLDSLPGLVQRSSTADHHQLAVHNPDRAVHALVEGGVPFRGITIRGASLEEALASIQPRGTRANASQLSS